MNHFPTIELVMEYTGRIAGIGSDEHQVSVVFLRVTATIEESSAFFLSNGVTVSAVSNREKTDVRLDRY